LRENWLTLARVVSEGFLPGAGCFAELDIKIEKEKYDTEG